MHLYHVHTKINITSLNTEDKHPRQRRVTVISLLISRVAVILAKQRGQIHCTRTDISEEKQANVLSLAVQFCNYAVLCRTIFLFRLGCVRK